MATYKVEVYMRGIWATLYLKATDCVDARQAIMAQTGGTVYAHRIHRCMDWLNLSEIW